MLCLLLERSKQEEFFDCVCFEGNRLFNYKDFKYYELINIRKMSMLVLILPPPPTREASSQG